MSYLNQAVGKECILLDAGKNKLIKVFVPQKRGTDNGLQTVVVTDNLGNHHYKVNEKVQFGKKMPVINIKNKKA